jgi:hypothetical protein
MDSGNHARMAALGKDLLVFEQRGLWRRTGMPNCEDWVTANLGSIVRRRGR